jgi:hypothetical protein
VFEKGGILGFVLGGVRLVRMMDVVEQRARLGVSCVHHAPTDWKKQDRKSG